MKKFFLSFAIVSLTLASCSEANAEAPVTEEEVNVKDSSDVQPSQDLPADNVDSADNTTTDDTTSENEEDKAE